MRSVPGHANRTLGVLSRMLTLAEVWEMRPEGVNPCRFVRKYPEMARASNYSAGDTVIFYRRYKTLGVEKGDEREVERVDYERNTVWLGDGNGNLVDWRPYMLAGEKGGVEVYRSEEMELRKGDRVRWTRNDPGSGSPTARPRLWNRSERTASASVLRTDRRPDWPRKTPNSGTSTGPGRLRCMLSRAGRWTKSLRLCPRGTRT